MIRSIYISKSIFSFTIFAGMPAKIQLGFKNGLLIIDPAAITEPLSGNLFSQKYFLNFLKKKLSHRSRKLQILFPLVNMQILHLMID